MSLSSESIRAKWASRCNESDNQTARNGQTENPGTTYIEAELIEEITLRLMDKIIGEDLNRRLEDAARGVPRMSPALCKAFEDLKGQPE